MDTKEMLEKIRRAFGLVDESEEVKSQAESEFLSVFFNRIYKGNKEKLDTIKDLV